MKTKTTFIESFTAPRRAGGGCSPGFPVPASLAVFLQVAAFCRRSVLGNKIVVAGLSALSNRLSHAPGSPRSGENCLECISALGAAENPSALERQRPRAVPAFLLGCRISSEILENPRKKYLDITGGLCLGNPLAVLPGLFPGCFPLSFRCPFPVSSRLPSVPGLPPWLVGFRKSFGAVPPTSSIGAYRSTDSKSNQAFALCCGNTLFRFVKMPFVIPPLFQKLGIGVSFFGYRLTAKNGYVL